MQKCKCHLSKSFILIVALILATFSWRVYLCLANILPKVWICFSFLLGASKCINIITNYGERSWGRDLEEKNETFLLLLVCCYVVPLVARKNPIYDQEWLWDNEVLSLFLFSFRQQSSCVCVCVSFKEESCTTITPKALEKTGLVWKTIVKM